MIRDPIQRVECDQCDEEEDFDMTALARHSWDNRHLAAKMKRAGWLTRDGKHFCSWCAQEMAE